MQGKKKYAHREYQISNFIFNFRVHYKNWNKRYDEWVELTRIMRIYDEAGQVLKSRVISEKSQVL